MKIIKKFQRGEIATVLTAISIVVMIVGIITGSVINERGTRTTSEAVETCSLPTPNPPGSDIDDNCANCIITNSPDTRTFFNSNGHGGCSNKQIVDHWCGGGVSTEGTWDCLINFKNPCIDAGSCTGAIKTSPPDGVVIKPSPARPFVTSVPNTPIPTTASDGSTPTITAGGPTLTPTPTIRGGGPVLPTLPLNQKTKFVYHLDGIDCWLFGLCRHNMQGTKATFETTGVAPTVENLVEEAWGGSGTGFRLYTKDVFFTTGRAYTAKIVTTYTDNQKAGMTCIHTDFAPPPPKIIDATTTAWDVWGKLTPDTDCSAAPTPTPAPEAGVMRDLDVVYHVSGVCKNWAVCDHNYKNGNWNGGDGDIMAEVWYKIADSSTPPSYIALQRDFNFDLNPLDPYIDMKKYKVPFQVGKTYKASASFKYQNKGTLCIAYKDETKTITGVDTEFRFDYSLIPATDCTNPDAKPSLLRGSSNQDFIVVIDKYARGEIGAHEVSAFISQLNRSPFQPVYCTCPGGNCSQCTGPVYPAQGEENI